MKALHIGALWAFAFVQPLFDVLGQQAQFFVARANTTADIVVFALVFTFVPPALLAALVWAAGRIRCRRWPGARGQSSSSMIRARTGR